MTQTPDDTRIALISKDISYIQRDIGEIKSSVEKLAGTYVTSTEFHDFVKGDYANIKKLVYGFIGLLLTAFGLAIINFFIKK